MESRGEASNFPPFEPPKFKFNLFGKLIPPAIFGPAMILLAFGQATGELIHWPYLTVKYQTHFLWLLLPACAIQFPVLWYLARHTLLTGESFFSSLVKSSRFLAIIAWIVFLVTTIWISSYTASGGVAVAVCLNKFANTQLDVGQWAQYFAIALNLLYFLILMSFRRTSGIISSVMTAFAALSLAVVTSLFIYSIIHSGFDPSFFASLFQVDVSAPNNWNVSDWKLLLSAVIFAGLGGLWNLLYSTWVRDRGLGMASFNKDEFREYQRALPDIRESSESVKNYRTTIARFGWDLAIGLSLNFLMLLMLVYITFRSFPAGQAPPTGLGIITTLADSATLTNPLVGLAFYVAIGLFLADTWLAAADALSKVHANFVIGLISQSKPDFADEEIFLKPRAWYALALTIMFLMTIVSSLIAQPQQLNYLNGVLSGLGSVVLISAIFVNESVISKKHSFLSEPKLMRFFLYVALGAYLFLGLAYVYYF